jgi:type II secretory pathway pseudopilin PulG
MQESTNNSGFTIAELLVAASVSILVVALLGTMFSSLTRVASRGSATIDAFRDARSAIQLMKRDLSSIVVARPSGSPVAAYFVIDTDNAGALGAAVRQIDALVSSKNQPAGVPTPTPGDVCAVRYYCGWDTNGRTYTLKRFFRDSKSTAQAFQSTYPTYLDLTTLYKQSATADEALAAYAWSLRVTAYDSSGNIITPMTDPSGYQTTTAQYICDPSVASTNALPATIEISFKAMSPAAGRTVVAETVNNASAYNIWMAGDNGPNASASDLQLYQRLIEPNTYVFRTRIDLH